MTNWSAMSTNDYVSALGNALLSLRTKCQRLGVGFELCYEESSNTWYTRIVSASPAETFIGKSRIEPGHAIGDAENWIGTQKP